jgi:hypothetical protein
MSEYHTSAFGVFADRMNAEQCISELLNAGFQNQDVSVLASDSASFRQLSTENSTKMPEGTATGATTGGLIGGALGLLAGIGAIAIPGVGPFIAAGPIMGALAGLGAGAAAGGVVGALVGVGIPEYEAKRYEGYVRRGSVLVSVHGSDADWVNKAKEIMKDNNATDISSTEDVPVKKAG